MDTTRSKGMGCQPALEYLVGSHGISYVISNGISYGIPYKISCGMS